MPIVHQIKSHKLILDTHIWLWLMEGSSTLSTRFLRAVDHCQEQNNILISPISIWEIGMLVEKKRIQIDMVPLDWVEKALELPGIILAPITPRVAIQSCRLPDSIHGDPADRLLVATAHEYNAVLVTADRKLLDYGKYRYITVYDPT